MKPEIQCSHAGCKEEAKMILRTKGIVGKPYCYKHYAEARLRRMKKNEK